jgi:hypothetical protein
MGFLRNLLGGKSKRRRPVPGAGVFADSNGEVIYNMLDPAMKQFMGRCIGAVKKSGIKAKGSGQFSILLGDDGGQELALTPFWQSYQGSQDQAVFNSVAELARRMTGVGPEPTVEQLYPYVLPESYLAHQETEPAGITRPFGHGLHAGLVFDLDGLVESLGAEGLRNLDMTPEQAHARAIENLELLAQEQAIKMVLIPDGPSGKPFVLVGGHWAAATSILLPGLGQLVEGPLGSSDVLISIPHRDAMLVFSNGDRAHRDALRATVREKESDGDKPLTFELFTLTSDGVRAFEEGP